MSKVYWLWHGGASYAAPASDDYDTFASLGAAKSAFQARLSHCRFPAVTRAWPEAGGPEALLYGQPPTMQLDPDARLYLGPRGGVRVERC